MLQIQQSAPGRWLAASVPGRLVVVECETPSTAFAESLWQAVAHSEDVQPVLDHLTRNGLLATPAFAVAEWDDAAPSGRGRFIVRGSARIVVGTAAGERQVSASGVSTWLEQVFEDVATFRVELDTAPKDEDILVPFSTGAAWVTRVRSSAEALEPSRADSSTVTEANHVDPSTVTEATVVESFESGPVAVIEAEVGYDHLFGATMMRSVEDAAVRDDERNDDGAQQLSSPVTPIGSGIVARAETTEVSATDVASSDHELGADEIGADKLGGNELGDHDGLTVFSGDIHKLRTARVDAAIEGNAPTTAVPSAAPGFVLQLTDGVRESLEGTVLVGRAPSASKVSGGRMPKLLTVGSADQDISRTHVQFAVEGDTVVVTDLHSRNGTLIVLPGKSPQKLRQGEPTSVIVGTLVDLGGGVTMTVGHA